MMYKSVIKMDIDGRNICILLSTALITGRLITFSMWVGQVKLAYFNFCFLSIVLKIECIKVLSLLRL